MFRVAPLLVGFLLLSPVQASRLVLRGGRVLDGSGAPPVRADVAIEGGHIVAVGTIAARADDEVLQVSDRIVAPGFIDLHNHSARGILAEPTLASQVSQGLTTILLGPDGESPFPTGPYLEKLRQRGVALNVGLMVGHGTLRSLVMGTDFKREATPEEVEAMRALVALAMSQGAFGLSSGLEYDPGFYSSTRELVVLAREAARHGGFYMSHIRDEEEGFLGALKEAIQIGREAGIPVQISHIKLGNRHVWGRVSEALDLLHRARRAGIQITADCYPYTAWASGLSVLIPSRRFQDREEVSAAFEKVGGAGNVLITRYPPNPGLEFKTVAQIAGEQKRAPEEIFMEMMRLGGASVVVHSMRQADVDQFYRDPLVMVASDGGLDSRHPRKAGTFPRVLGRYVRERHILSLAEAVRRMTSLPAQRLGLKDRGLLRPGYWADLVVFDPKTVRDLSTFQNPDRLSQGIDLTLVNGTPVWQNHHPTHHLPGHPLPHPQN